MTNPSTMPQESPAGYQAAGSIAKADLFMTLSDGNEMVCSLDDGKTTLIKRGRSGQILEVKTIEHLRNLELPQVVQELKGKLLNVLDFNGLDLPVPNGLPVVDPNLGLLKDNDLASPLVSCTEDQITNSVGPLTGYFEKATPVGSQRPESATEERFHDNDAEDSFSITAEANNLHLAGSEGYFQPATPVPSSQREWLSAFLDNEAISSPNRPEGREPRYPSSFEFCSSVTETERSLERDIENSLLWGEANFESRIPDD
ncbi:hypothetical protein HOLleu_35452 [Holothuria leucospilota]|uniref:Uncharacterized protein n=1 Tax=Holothuria leucospilota TaxID=206669 RepID=A0A9Q0YMQ3_HOLLE|nr:hypothetical protein HOLleu_35452 [Holothuria leucospilota]